jgi:hypothetical protein
MSSSRFETMARLWRNGPPEVTGAGLGLYLISSLSDDCELRDLEQGGTEILVGFHLRGEDRFRLIREVLPEVDERKFNEGAPFAPAWTEINSGGQTKVVRLRLRLRASSSS